MAYGRALTRKLYYRCPVALQNVACTWYGLGHQRRYRGRHFWECFQALQKQQWLSSDEVSHLQWLRLQHVLRHAYQHVSFYRRQWQELGLTPEDIRTAEDFQKLPLLEKETVRQNTDLFLSGAFRKSELHSAHTSGTTGKQLSLWLSQEAYEREYSFRWHHYSWSGVALGGRIAYLAGHPVVAVEHRYPPFSRHNFAERSLLFSSQHLSEENLPHYVRELRGFSPDLIEGYPSSLYLLAAYMFANGIRDIRPRGVYTTSETLFDFQRQVIEAAFGTRVLNWYGNTERAGNIIQCGHGRLHVQHAHAFTEVLDESGLPARAGESGELIFSSLSNLAFPLIRYRVGDVAIPGHGSCECGRNGQLMERIVGRIEDYVISTDGRYFGRLDHIFKDTERVREAQIVQDRLDHLVFRIVPREGYGAEDTAKILGEAKTRLGNSFQIDLRLERHIERGTNGKFCFIVSHLKTEQQKNMFAHSELSMRIASEMNRRGALGPGN